jgi:hypothetical protein
MKFNYTFKYFSVSRSVKNLVTAKFLNDEIYTTFGFPQHCRENRSLYLNTMRSCPVRKDSSRAFICTFIGAVTDRFVIH